MCIFSIMARTSQSNNLMGGHILPEKWDDQILFVRILVK